MPKEMTAEEIKRLKESEVRYRRMIEQAADAILVIDPESGDIIEANLQSEVLLGRSREEITGCKVWEIHPPEDRERAQQLFEQVTKLGVAEFDSLHFIRKDGSRVTVDVSASIIEYGSKKVIQRICRDATRRTELEKENAYLRKYYEYILNMMPVGLGILKDVNLTPTVEFENASLKKLFDHAHCDQGELPWHKHDTICSGSRTTLSETGSYVVEWTYPDGHVYQFTSTCIRDESNNWMEIYVIQDVTHRRKLEDDLKEARDDLEQKVTDRTRQLQEKQVQLIQAEKMASLGNLVAGIAHEINTPLGALSSNNDLFIRTIKKIIKIIEAPDVSDEIKNHPKLRAHFDSIHKLNDVNREAADRIVKIVTGLRSFARLDQAEMDIFSLEEGLNSTLNLVHHELKNRIEVTKNLVDLPKIACYPNQINQVFMNLLVNACQAIEGKGTITINGRKEGGHVILEFTDSGRGISAEHLGRIFDPGFTTKGAGVGTGLGLSIVHQIIQQHRGTIKVTSEVGKGTTFRLSLPVSAGKDET